MQRNTIKPNISRDRREMVKITIRNGTEITMNRLSDYWHNSRKYCFFSGLILALSLNVAVASQVLSPDHVGRITAQELLATYPNFAKEYARFEPSEAQLNEIQALAGKEIVALFGTWCHDSVREVPRLLKLLDLGQVQFGALTLYGVSRQKSDPDGYSEKYGLRYTPTFVVSDDAGEIARVIERPNDSLAGDLASQINGEK